MPRWSPDAESRLRQAALSLFQERGYEAVTIADIAQRADLTRRSFFRHFPDKREVLFAGSERLPMGITERLEELGPDIPLPDAVFQVLQEAGEVLLTRGADQAIRRQVIDSSPELQERERTKWAAVADALAESLRHRGVDVQQSHMLGVISAELFRSAYDRAVVEPATFKSHLADARAVVIQFLSGPGTPGPR